MFISATTAECNPPIFRLKTCRLWQNCRVSLHSGLVVQAQQTNRGHDMTTFPPWTALSTKREGTAPCCGCRYKQQKGGCVRTVPRKRGGWKSEAKRGKSISLLFRRYMPSSFGMGAREPSGETTLSTHAPTSNCALLTYIDQSEHPDQGVDIILHDGIP